MNDLLLMQEIVAVLAGDGYSALRDSLRPPLNPDGTTPEAPLPPNLFAPQAAANTSRPMLVISGTFDNYGVRRLGTLTFELRGRTGDETSDSEHQYRFALLWEALLGTNAKANLKAALADRGAVAIDDYGPAPQNAFVADVDGEDLRTTLQFRIAWKFTS